MKYMINRQLHAFECNLGIIALGNGKIALGFACGHFLMQLYPNYTQKHVITYTNSGF